MKNIENFFTIKLCSDSEYNELVVDVYWKNYPLAMLSCDKGPENIEIEIYPPPEDQSSWKFTLSEITNVLEAAKNYLLE
ncbi:unknown protein [Waddlia chondrophila 2032/99]|uniref:Uncharacterized protein n=1 Tax=Waddlia chondrophila 2032/99 TaxID=765953 RepID=F8LDJ0_9BACT|nr:hypothetical protein [Waddlia chondrophila]CCB91466.1 unknown protein [Waddlia chondrophila 2032/99]